MRDLRSALSWLLLRDRSCDDVATLLARSDDQAAEELASLYYPDAFAHDGTPPPDSVDDRLVRLLRGADVGFVNNPRLDNALDREPAQAVPWMTFEERSGYAWDVIRKLAREAPRSVHEAGLPDLLRGRRAVVARLRRWAYYERRDDGWRSMAPYRSLGRLEQVTEPGDDSERRKAGERLRDFVLDAISLSEGMHSREVRAHYLALRVSRVKGPSLRSYRLFPKADFEVDVSAATRLSDFLEYVADAVDLKAVGGGGGARLRISLDLLEMLELIRSGYRPSPADLQGLFVNLMIFRNELLNLPFDRIVVTEDDRALFEILGQAGSDGSIRLKLARSGVAGAKQPAEAVQ